MNAVSRWLVLSLLLLVVPPAYAGDPCNHGLSRSRIIREREILRVDDGLFIGQRANVAYYTPLGNYYATNPNAFGKNAELTQAVAELTAAVKELRDMQGSGTSRGVDSLSYVHHVCNQCHSGTNAKGKFRTDVDLSAEDRLFAITMIMHDDPAKRMPKGKAIDAAIMSKLVQQLSTPPSSQLPAGPQRRPPSATTLPADEPTPQPEQYEQDPPPKPSKNGY